MTNDTRRILSEIYRTQGLMWMLSAFCVCIVSKDNMTPLVHALIGLDAVCMVASFIHGWVVSRDV